MSLPPTRSKEKDDIMSSERKSMSGNTNPACSSSHIQPNPSPTTSSSQGSPTLGPQHSVAQCPICDGGLCGVRVCSGDDPTEATPAKGFVMCDECEAVWLTPDVTSEHIYVDLEDPICPICHAGLWSTTHWADRSEVELLGWSGAINPDLDWEKS